jgi:hypothetical protein
MIGGFSGFVSLASGALNLNPIRLGASLQNCKALGLGIYINSLNSLLSRAIKGLAKFRDRRQREGIEIDRHNENRG